MSDIIRLLPDAVANQIAAGEVIQRPASAVKELLENAIDSGATVIKLVVKDSGKALIQVIDNGCGMSVTDARMAFERHATSKIKAASDLFAIRTMGFRGEALASIAAIAHVELRTKRTEDELGTQLNTEGSKVLDQQPIQCSSGTNIAVKNLFFNVPARRNFLKSNQVETRHIIDEFTRVAMVNPDVTMSFHHNEKMIFHLNNSNLKQRITALLGSQYSNRLVPVEEITEKLKIYGFVGKPEFARKTRGEQFFFANNRFIKHPYLHHSVDAAFQELLPKDTFPSYFIFIEIDPKTIDINIHPTKTEVNFQDSKMIYAMLRSAIRQSLGKYNITPSLDFESERSLDFPDPPKGIQINQPTIKINQDYNPFEINQRQSESPRKIRNQENWGKLYQGNLNYRENFEQEISRDSQQTELDPLHSGNAKLINEKIFQFKQRFIVTVVSSGIMLIDQTRAHERILYEEYLQQFDGNVAHSQQELFPETITFSSSDSEIINEIREDLKTIGFAINDLGKNAYVFTGRPADLKDINIKESIESIIENYRKNLTDLSLDKRINLVRSLSWNMAIKPGVILQKQEMNTMVDKLFACSVPDLSPSGKPVFKVVSIEEVEKLFN